MRSTLKNILVAALLSTSAAAWGQTDQPAGTTPPAVSTPTIGTVDTKMDRIARIAAKMKGSLILFDQSITPDTINAGAQQSPQPSYQWWFSFRPRVYLRNDLSLRLRMDLTTEWTNAGADTTRVREPLFGDIWLDLAYNPPKFGGIMPTVALRTVWGTSKDSIAAGSVARIGAVAGLVRPFETRKAGVFELSLSMYGLYNFVTHTTPGVLGDGYSCQTIEQRPTVCTSDTNPQNTQFSLTTFMAAKWAPIPQVSIALNYAVLDSWAYQNPDITLPNGTPVPRIDDTRFRQSGWFIASIDYDPRDWVSLSLGYYSLRPILDPDGTYGNPFYKPGGNTRIFLTTTFNLDRVYDVAARRAQKPQVAESPKLPVNAANLAWWRH